MFDTINDIPVKTVFITTEYDKFTGTNDNRTSIALTIDELYKDPKRKKLIESIKASKGNINPIIVNNDGKISEGHNRFIICRDLKLPLKYEILDSTLDEAIDLSSTNKPWTPIELLERGKKRNVPLCDTIYDILNNYPYLTLKRNNADGTMALAQLVVRCIRKMDDKLIPTYENIFTLKGRKMLVTNEKIEELKKIEIPKDILENLYNEMRVFNNMIKLTFEELSKKENDEKYKFNYLTINTGSTSSLVDCGLFIIRNESTFMKEFTKLVKFKPNPSNKSKEEYLKLTSTDYNTVKQIFDDIVGKCVK